VPRRPRSRCAPKAVHSPAQPKRTRRAGVQPNRPNSAPAGGLRPRLEAVLALAGRGRLLADVGTDHGLVPVHAVRSGAFERALAIDVNEAPLEVARATVGAHGVAERVEVVLGDALAALGARDVDVLVLAGLSGRTFVNWCEAAPEVIARVRRVVIQPNGYLTLVRRYAHERELWLVDERVTLDGGRHFVTCAFEPRAFERQGVDARAISSVDPSYERSSLSLEAAFELGPLLAERRDPLAREMHEKERRRLVPLALREESAAIDGERGGERHQALLSIYEAGLRLWERQEPEPGVPASG